jgi:hypothetical protein
VNDELLARILDHLEGDDFDLDDDDDADGFDLPAFQRNHTLPRWLAQWPDYSWARQQFEDAREVRDWGLTD